MFTHLVSLHLPLHYSVAMNLSFLARGGVGEAMLRNTMGKLYSKKRRIHFLKQCLAEQVVPQSAPKQLKDGNLPFKSSAKAWINESIKDITDKLEIDLQEKKTLTAQGIRLPDRIMREIQQEDIRGRRNSERKLRNAINRSKWNTIGREDIYTNISDRILTDEEKQVLSLGSKFDTGKLNRDLSDMLITNHKWHDPASDQGLAQGIVLSAYASAKGTPIALPRRYMKALKGLKEDPSIVNTTADKGGGIVLMNTTDYKGKMSTHLDDPTTYRKACKDNAITKSKLFIKEVRSILKDCGKAGKKLIRLLPQNPRIPSMRGLPKLHKPGIPMRPITNGTGSAPHDLASKLAKFLTETLGSISGCHLKNSTDLINRLKNRKLRNKKLLGLDVVSLFTKVPIEEALAAARRALTMNPNLVLPVPLDTFMSLVEACVRFGAFEFDGEEYEQIEGLPMGSPLSGVLANLFMETLEADHYLGIVGPHALWVRYVDDITLVIAVRVVTEDLVARLNAIHPCIQFTYDEEQDGKLPVLDVMIKRNENHEPRFAVYRKPTHKDDYIHYLSAHSERVKSGVIIGLFLRALRICSPEFLDDEFKHVIQAFKRLHYPEGMILRLKNTAIKIAERGPQEHQEETRPIIVVPNCPLTVQLETHLGKFLRIATPAQTKVGEMIKTSRSQHSPADSVIYKIPCGDESCNSAYYGQTSRGLKTRLREHRTGFMKGDQNNPFLKHAWETNHLPKWEKAEVVQKGISSKPKRLFLESTLIRTCKNLNSNIRQDADFKLAKIAASATAPRQDTAHPETTRSRSHRTHPNPAQPP